MKNIFIFKVLALILVFLVGFSFNSIIMKSFAQELSSSLNSTSANASEDSQNSKDEDINSSKSEDSNSSSLNSDQNTKNSSNEEVTFCVETGYTTFNQYVAEDGKYYIFLPNGVDVTSNIKVEYTGNIVATQGGANATVSLDQQNNSINCKFNKFDQNNASANFTATSSENGNYDITLMKSTIPSLNINLGVQKGTQIPATLDWLHENKENKAANCKTDLVDDSNSGNNFSKDKVEMKGRGNTSWTIPQKKGYQIKFDKKQSVLGMSKAKKWILTANHFDGSLLRNWMAYNTADEVSDKYQVHCKYVDLWVNGEYRGNYLVSEKVEIDENSVNLTDDLRGVFELDNWNYEEEGKDYYRVSDKNNHYVLKDFDDKNKMPSDIFEDFMPAINNVENLSYSDNENNWDEIAKILDVESAARYFVINEFSESTDSTATSFYMYKDGKSDKIHFGPVWDFDQAFGNNRSNASNDFLDKIKDDNSHSSSIFTHLMQFKGFREEVKKVYDEKYKNILNEYMGNSGKLQKQADYLKTSANMNFTRWNILGKDNPAGKGLLPLEKTYQGNVDVMLDWINKRYNYYEKNLDEGVYNISSLIAPNMVLDISGGSMDDGANLQLYTANTTNAQDFQLIYEGMGKYIIKNINSGKYIDVAGAGTECGTNIWQYTQNPSAAQRWHIWKNDDGSYSLSCKCNNLYMDVNGGAAYDGNNIWCYSWNNTPAQKFRFNKLNPIANGTYTIKSSIDGNKVLDIDGASTDNMANCQLYSSNSTAAQKFNITYNENEQCYLISPVCSGKCLDVAGAGSDLGTNVWQWEYNNTNAQKWQIMPAGDGSYYFISKCNWLYLDVAEAQMNDGTNIQVYSGNNTGAQKFYIS